jgi:hypothetical protein
MNFFSLRLGESNWLLSDHTKHERFFWDQKKILDERDCSYFVLYTSKEKKGEKGKERKKYMWVGIAPKFNISIDLFWAEPVVSKKSTS